MAENARIPVACSLDASAVPGRVEEWKAVATRVTRRQVLEGGIRVEFGEGVDVARLAELVLAEQQCCPFFSFDITVDHRGIGLEVRAPDEGMQVAEVLLAG